MHNNYVKLKKFPQFTELPEPLPKDDDIDYELAQKEDQSSSTADTSKPSCSDHEQPSNSDSEQLQYIRSKGKKVFAYILYHESLKIVVKQPQVVKIQVSLNHDPQW